jgi:hypothetical protein
METVASVQLPNGVAPLRPFLQNPRTFALARAATRRRLSCPPITRWVRFGPIRL